jgi:tRNA modification GTPase
MIQNALTKAKYGGRLSFMRRLPLGVSLLPPFALTSIRYGISKPSVSWTTHTLSQRRFQTTDLTSFNHEYDTIYALSTAQGRAAIAIIRISGPGWQDVAEPLFPQ